MSGSKRDQNISCIVRTLKGYEEPQHKPVSEGQSFNNMMASVPKSTGTGTVDHERELRIPHGTEMMQGNEGQNKQDGYRQLIEECNKQYKEKKLEDATYCTVWDFAGQFAFYNTHQVFFSSRAIYLLVSDMSRKPDEKVDDLCYTDSDGERNLTSLEFIKFWLNLIHENCPPRTAQESSREKQYIEPPVVLVGTKADEYAKQNTSKKDKTLEVGYFHPIRIELLETECDEAVKHIREESFMIDNSLEESKNTRIKELRDFIYDLATKQSYWQEKHPVKWLILENVLIRLRNEKRLVLERSEILKLNEAQTIEVKLASDELEVFLKFHHETGNILYFSEETLRDHILLDPQWLIDAFKLLISDEQFISKKGNKILRLWKEFNSEAYLRKELIDEMWTDDFAKHTTTLLDYMEKLGLIVKPSPKVEWEWFAPCVLKKEVHEDLIKLESRQCGSFECETYTFTSKLCFTTSTKFIPVAIFNRLLAACIREWEVYKRNKECHLYCGCGIFQLRGGHLLYVFFYANVVQIWIKRNTTKKDAPSGELCLKVKCFVKKFLNSCFHTKLDEYYKCPTADTRNTEMHKDENLACDAVHCTFHENEVKWKDLTNSWSQDREYTFLAMEEERKKQRSPENNSMFDGRLIMLKEDDIKHLESTCKDDDNHNLIARGGFGDIYKCGKLFGVPVVVKVIRSDVNHQNVEESAKREMMVARIRHQFILPLLATHRREGTFWFMSPYCKNGDLAKAIPAKKMDLACRVRILFQLAKAVEYLHTPVKNVRASIIHKDISSPNVLLDDWFNVRLIDFGLAREENDLTNNASGRETYTHPDVGRSVPASEYWDYYSFGVVMRELLTSLTSYGTSNTYLKNMRPDDILQNLAAEFKVEGKVSPIADCLNQISNKCLNPIPDNCRETTKQPVAIFKKEAIDELDGMLRSYGYGTEEKMDPDKCHLCMLNPKGERKKAENHCCINVCVSCEKNSFMNPIKCHCGYEIKPVIGHNWGALLIAGNDKDPDLAKRFESDVSKFKNVITSKAPLVMGVSDDKIQTVLPDGQESQSMSDKVLKAITNLHSDLETLIIYISCHGKKDDAKGTFTFELSKSKGITLNEFQNALETQLKQLTKVMVFFDCCNPPKISLEGTKVVQINACGSDQRAYAITKDASCFTTFLVQGLTAYAVGNPCGTSGCKKCKEYWHHRTDYVTVGNLIRYINGHMDVNQTAKIHMIEGTHDDINIAYYTDEEMQIKFTETDSKDTADGNEIELQLEFFKTMKKIKEELRRRFDKHKSDYNVTIKSGTFRKDVEFKECNSIEKVILAWVYRLPLYVTFKKPVEPEQPEATPSVPEPVEETPKPAVPEEPVAEKTTESETPSPTPTDENIPKVEIKIEDENDKLEEGEIVDDEEKETMSMGLRYKYSEEQWSPLNPEGKKHYDRDFLLQFQNDYNAIQKPAGLPDILDIILDKKKQGEGGNPDEAQSSNAGNYIAVVVGIGLIIGGIIIQKVLGGSF
ncbi:uncharacterized protein LOC128548550 isoform X2 [Mercenaria mercenaria]|uniref:uncharacterized protein LOC128548550 isoform X2 n=1 Tax=Mercenaria mercenaria TaxID=6596 RepID=UPI00234F8D4D|nr:uncharacterized protein LOC128548550 isoform X2 [Mercenaria mercenaria]